MQYLDELLAKHKITSQAHYYKLVQTLETKHDFSIPHQLCKSGDLTALSFFRSKLPALSLEFVDPSGQNCLHYAVGRNHYNFVKHLLNNESKVNVN